LPAPPVFPVAPRVVARLWSHVGTELIKLDSAEAAFEPLWVPACEAAADCSAVPEVLVVCGGSVNAVSCEAVDDEPA
jgi:hypothetical protein